MSFTALGLIVGVVLLAAFVASRIFDRPVRHAVDAAPTRWHSLGRRRPPGDRMSILLVYCFSVTATGFLWIQGRSGSGSYDWRSRLLISVSVSVLAAAVVLASRRHDKRGAGDILVTFGAALLGTVTPIALSLAWLFA